MIPRWNPDFPLIRHSVTLSGMLYGTKPYVGYPWACRPGRQSRSEQDRRRMTRRFARSRTVSK